MAVSPEYRAFIEDRLSPLGEVTTRRMFSGLGVFYRGVMFALVARDQVFLKVDDTSRGDFEAAGSDPFGYDRNGKPFALKSYYAVPDAVLEDDDDLLSWARRAVDAALQADAQKSKKKRRRKPAPDL